MYKNTFKNWIINKTSYGVKQINDLIKIGLNLIEYSEQMSDISPGYVCTEHFIGWKSRVESFLLTLDKQCYYNNFRDYCKNDTEQAVNNGISILNSSRDYLRSGYSSGNYWNYSNPFWLAWQLFILLWRHKIISLFISIAIGLLTTYLAYRFGWN